jgi:hypothetical protein
MRRSFWFNLFLVCVGIVVGTLAADMCAKIPLLSWLSYGMSFGIPTASLNLHVIDVTFGLSLNLNIAVILFIVLSVWLGHLMAKK